MTAPFPPLVVEWLESQRSSRTRVAYESAVRQWMEWLPVDYLAAKRSHGDKWRNHLTGAGKSPRTVARMLATVSSLYDWLEAEEHIGRSPMVRVKRPKVDRRQGSTLALSREDAARLLSAARDAGPRTHVAVYLMLTTAIRAQELLTTDVSKAAVAGNGAFTLRVTRKGGESDVVALPDECADHVRELIGGRRRGPLLAVVEDGGRPWSYWQLHRAVKAAGKAAGLGDDVTPHVLRTTWVTLALERGVSLADAQDVMGHASAETTRGYDRNRDGLKRKTEAVNVVEAALRG